MDFREAIEGNKLIAEFDGLKKDTYGKYFKGAKFMCSNLHDLTYHKSWDLLMPVVETIRDKGYSVHITTFYYSEKHSKVNGCRIALNKKEHRTDFHFVENTDDLIKCVWQCIVKYIKWLNEQKK